MQSMPTWRRRIERDIGLRRRQYAVLDRCDAERCVLLREQSEVDPVQAPRQDAPPDSSCRTPPASAAGASARAARPG
jgi:hypothetical protein